MYVLMSILLEKKYMLCDYYYLIIIFHELYGFNYGIVVKTAFQNSDSWTWCKFS